MGNLERLQQKAQRLFYLRCGWFSGLFSDVLPCLLWQALVFNAQNKFCLVGTGAQLQSPVWSVTLTLGTAFFLAFVFSQMKSIVCARQLCLNGSVLRKFWERAALRAFCTCFLTFICVFFDRVFVNSTFPVSVLSLLHSCEKHAESEVRVV